MGADQDSFQRTVVAVGAVICALLNGTLNALVCMAVHSGSSFYCDVDSMTVF